MTAWKPARYRQPIVSEQQPAVDVSLRVRYAETDQMGVAYHSNYLIWFEVGRTTYCRCCGVTYAEMERRSNAYLPVVEAQCRYRVPLAYDQLFIVRTWIDRLRTRAVSFGYSILDGEGGETLAEGLTRHVVTDSEGRPRRLPGDLYQRLGELPDSSPIEVTETAASLRKESLQ